MNYRQFVDMNDYIPADVSSSVMLSSTEVNDYIDLNYKPEAKPERKKMNKKVAYYCVRYIPVVLLELLLIINLICDCELCGISANVHSLRLSQTSRVNTVIYVRDWESQVFPAYFNATADLLYIEEHDKHALSSGMISDIFPTIIMFNYTQVEDQYYYLSELLFQQDLDGAVRLDFINPKRRKVQLITPAFDYTYWRTYVGDLNAYKCGGKALQTNLSIISGFDASSNLPIWWLNLDEFTRWRAKQCQSDYQLQAHISYNFCLEAMIFRYLRASKLWFNTTVVYGNMILDLDVDSLNGAVLLDFNYSYIHYIYLTKATDVVYFHAVSSSIVFALPEIPQPCRVDPSYAAYNSSGICRVAIYGTVYRESSEKKYSDYRMQITYPLQYGTGHRFTLVDSYNQCVWRAGVQGVYSCYNNLFAVAEIAETAGWKCHIAAFGEGAALYCYCTNCE